MSHGEMPDPDTRFLTYLKAFSTDMLTRMSGPLSVPFAAFALWASSRTQKVLWGCLAVLCAVFASYRVWRNERKCAGSQLEAVSSAKAQEIESLRLAKDEEIDSLNANKDQEIEALKVQKDGEIASLKAERDLLKHRPYDEEHLRLAEGKVNKLSEVSLDLVWYLLHYGKTEAIELRKHCKHEPEFDDAVQRARDAGLVKDSYTGDMYRPSARFFWEVNPAFEAVLRDLLGNRKTSYF